jgi:general secretion pathway protein D
LHNKQATIFVGEDIPYVGSVSENTGGTRSYSTSIANLGTMLDITPRIMPDGMIAMAIYVRRSSLIELIQIGESQQAPHSKATEATTQLNAMDGQTVIFAGLINEQKETNNRSIPFLNKIPVVKHLFEYDSKSYKRSELLIVLTPTIIRTRDDMEILNQQERERIHWCTYDVVKLMGDAAMGGMRLRSDEWMPEEVPHTYGAPMPLNDSQLPPESKTPMAPIIVPMLEK